MPALAFLSALMERGGRTGSLGGPIPSERGDTEVAPASPERGDAERLEGELW